MGLDPTFWVSIVGPSYDYSINELIGCQGPDKLNTLGSSLTSFGIWPRIPKSHLNALELCCARSATPACTARAGAPKGSGVASTFPKD